LCFFLIIFFQFNTSTSSWLRIELHNLFWFAFYGVILVSRLRYKVWQVNQYWLRFFLIDFFFQFFLLTLSLLRIKFHNLFWFAFCRVIMVFWPGLCMWKVNPCWSRLIQYVIVSILKKKISSWIFRVKLYFYLLFGLFLYLQS